LEEKYWRDKEDGWKENIRVIRKTAEGRISDDKEERWRKSIRVTRKTGGESIIE